MNNLQRIGGVCAVVFGLTLLVATVLLIPPYVNMPAEAYQEENVEARLAFAGSLGTSERVISATSFALQILAPPFLLPTLLALYIVLRGSRPVHALLGLAFSALGVPFLMILNMNGFVFLGMSKGFGSAVPAEQAARAAAYMALERFSTVSEAVFWMVFGTGLVLFSIALRREGFPGWLAIFGRITVAVGVLGVIGAAIAFELGILLGLAGLLLAFWAIALGITLYRRKSAP